MFRRRPKLNVFICFDFHHLQDTKWIPSVAQHAFAFQPWYSTTQKSNVKFARNNSVKAWQPMNMLVLLYAPQIACNEQTFNLTFYVINFRFFHSFFNVIKQRKRDFKCDNFKEIIFNEDFSINFCKQR